MTAAAERPKEYAPVPDGFDGIELGLSMDEVKKRLKENDNFSYTGDPDVSLQDRPNETALDVEGLGYVYRGIFQFYEDSLYIIMIMINPDRMDHYSMFTHLSGKYGPPQIFSPSRSVWERDGTMMVLERPLTVRYMDRETFNKIVDAGEKEESLESDLRRSFINQF
ncbi:MAG: hypothetical protein JW874_09970 [Spirochaetales bacterium]|nr:hypothetical protein [Spirochaetales bacterium]